MQMKTSLFYEGGWENVHEETPLPDMRTTVVCVDRMQDGIISGEFFNLSQEKPEMFYGLSDLILKMDLMYDHSAFPQAALAMRSFAKHSEKYRLQSQTHQEQPKALDCGVFDSMVLHRDGKLETFHIRVRFRQNASWQGELYWRGKKRKMAFRSVLEVMNLLQEAMDCLTQALEIEEAC